MSSIDTMLLVFFTTGFTVGFGHCIGMCGPIVVSLSLSLEDRSIFLPHFLYHSGRIVTYGLLGGLMGVTGSFVQITARIAVIQKTVMILAGLLIVVMGFAMTGWIPLGRIFKDHSNPGGFINQSFRRLFNIHATPVYFPLGLLLGLLPCGPVYTALIAAARAGMNTQEPIRAAFSGMGVMVSFGMGTIPALLLVARLTSMGWLKNREIIYKIGSVLMVAVGLYFVAQGIRY